MFRSLMLPSMNQPLRLLLQSRALSLASSGHHLVFDQQASFPGFQSSCLPEFHQKRSYMKVRDRAVVPTLREFNKRRKIVELKQKLKGEVPDTRRSNHLEWNYSAELMAFGVRLSEKFDQQILAEAFVTNVYLEAEKQRQKDLGLENVSEARKSQDSLAAQGDAFLARCLSAWLRSSFPAFPEEGIQALKDFLMEEEMLAEVSFHIGTRELILCEEYPPSRFHMAQTYKSVVGALIASSGEDRASKFVIEILAAQLVGKDLNDIWELTNPMGLLTGILERSGRGLPEPRLLWETGPHTLLASYHVGIYSDQELIGQSAGESIEIAEDMAARDCLRRLFDTEDNRSPMALKMDKEQLEASEPNMSASQWNIDDHGRPSNIIRY